MNMKITGKHVGIIVGIIFVIAIGYWFLQNRSMSGTEALNPAEVTTLIETVGEYVVLPEGVDAGDVKVAAVQDATLLAKSSSFFKDAQNGDQLLIFPTKLILFRPSEKKVVNISAPAGLQQDTDVATNAAIASGNMAATSTNSVVVETLTEKLTVEIRNGSGIAGLAGKYKTVLGTDVTRATVSKTGNAANEDYSDTVIVYTKGKNISDIENVFKVKSIGALPPGEAAVSADVLVILGKNAK